MNETLSVIIILIVFAAVLYLLSAMKKNNMSFTVRVITGMVAGLIFGGILQMIFGFGSSVIETAGSWMSIVGQGYVRLLYMIVMPLIFISILSAFVTQKSQNLGKIAGRVLAVLMVTVSISVLVGALTTNAFKLDTVGIQIGENETARGQKLESSLQDLEKTPLQQQILEIIPRNPFAAMAGQGSNATLATVFFATMLAVAAIQIRKIKPESAENFERGVRTLHDVIMRLVSMIMKLTPYGVFALMTGVASQSNVSDILRLLKFVLASYIAFAIMFVIHLVILSLFKINPVKYLKKAASPLIFAFTSRTSAGTLPLTIKSQHEAMGVSEGIANLSSTLGVSIGQNGCAGIYPAMLAVMLAPTMGINPLDPVFLIKLVVITAIASFGIAGVGGGATFAALTVLSALGFPVGLAGVLIAIEPLIDMGRTALNVSDSMVAGLVTARTMNELDDTVLNDDSKVAEMQ